MAAKRRSLSKKKRRADIAQQGAPPSTAQPNQRARITPQRSAAAAAAVGSKRSTPDRQSPPLADPANASIIGFNKTPKQEPRQRTSLRAQAIPRTGRGAQSPASSVADKCSQVTAVCSGSGSDMCLFKRRPETPRLQVWLRGEGRAVPPVLLLPTCVNANKPKQKLSMPHHRCEQKNDPGEHDWWCHL